jgi:PAS domain S-box-containing protein
MGSLWPLIASVVTAILIFAFDLLMPLGVAAAMPYIGLVLLGLWFEDRRAVFVLAAVGTVLTFEGYLLSELSGVPWIVLTNRGLAIAAIWVTAVLCYQRRRHEATTVETERKHSEAALADSEHRLRTITENAPVEIILKDTEGRFLLVNKAFTDMFGKKDDDLLGKTVFDIFPRETAEAITRHEKEVLETGRTVEREERVLRLDGVHTLRSIKFPVRDAYGETVGIGTVATDVTDHKRAEEKRREIEDRLRLVANAMPGSISYIDSNYRYLFANDRYREFYGLDPDTLIGKRVHEVMGPMFEKLKDHIGEALTGKMVVHEGVFDAPNGKSWPFHATYIPHITDTHEVVGFFTLTQNITDRKQAEKELIAAKDEAVLANRAKNEFLASMSHELRTPLNAILGFSETMEAQLFGPLGNKKYVEYTTNILESGRHLLYLINNILDISMIEADQMDLYREKTDAAELVRSVVDLVRPGAEHSNIRLSLTVAESILPIYTDQRRFKQIIYNLLSNAIKFVTKGGEVKVLMDTEGDRLRIVITDTGIGMEPDEVEKALAIFQQVDGRLERAYEGSGLGLPLAKSLTELHGGTLELASRKGEGTSVTVRLPLDGLDNAEKIKARPLEPGRRPVSHGSAEAPQRDNPSRSLAARKRVKKRRTP